MKTLRIGRCSFYYESIHQQINFLHVEVYQNEIYHGAYLLYYSVLFVVVLP